MKRAPIYALHQPLVNECRIHLPGADELGFYNVGGRRHDAHHVARLQADEIAQPLHLSAHVHGPFEHVLM